MKYLLIDGNNLAIRAAFANEEMQNKQGDFSGVHYGFFNSIISLKKIFPDYEFLIVWDGKSQRRIEESNAAVELGIIDTPYKDNRKTTDETPITLLNFFEQSDFLKRAIYYTGIPQIRFANFEADDVIASYCHKLKSEAQEVVIASSDQDYIQLLDKNVKIYNLGKNEILTKSYWENENEISTEKYVEIGALMGDSGDNIHGVPSWGLKTAIKELKKFGSCEGILYNYKIKYKDIIEKHNVEISKEDFDILKFAKNNNKESSKLKFPFITQRTKYLGICKALNENQIKMPKNELFVLMFEERMKLALSLKKMDSYIVDLPEIERGEFNFEKILEYFTYYDIEKLKQEIKILEEAQ